MPDVVTVIAGEGRLAQLVAIHTGDHGYVSLLPERIPVFRRTVAHRTFHLGTDVFLVPEENEVGKTVHSGPRKQLIFFLKLSQFLDGGAVLHDGPVAAHAFFDPRYLKSFASPQWLMAGVTLHPSQSMAVV